MLFIIKMTKGFARDYNTLRRSNQLSFELKDRGTHQAFGVVTNAQDFMRLLYLELLQRQISQ